MPTSLFRRAAFFVLAVSLVGAGVACSTDDKAPAAAPATHDAGEVSCANDSRVKPFAAGMQAKSTSGKLVVDLVNASPSPPQSGTGDAGINTWTLKITVDGQTPKDAVTVTTLMPDHGHGSPMKPVLTANPDGTSTLSDLFLFMGGVWQITFTESPQEFATFAICLD
jgi:hypothetical protein